jgi:transposase
MLCSNLGRGDSPLVGRGTAPPTSLTCCSRAWLGRVLAPRHDLHPCGTLHQAHAAQVLIAECGLDMTLFPTVGHFASWAGACPGHNQSAGRRRSGRTRPGPRWLTDQLTECARAAVRTKETYLAAHFAQLRGRRGEPKAIGAIRHDLLVAYYHIVRDQVPYRDLGPDWQRKRYSVEHRARRLQRQLEALGYAVTLDQVDAEQAA